MRSGTKRLTGLIAISAAALIFAAACSTTKAKSTPQFSSSWKDCVAQPNTCNSGPTKPGGTMLVTDEKDITSFFVADAASNTYDQAQIMNGLIPSPFIVRPDSSVVLNTDMMQSATLISTSPQTVEYKIKANAVWNDGTPIDGNDFMFAWKFQDGKDCSATDCPVAGTTGYDSISNITQKDNGKTVDVTWSTVYPDWRALFALWPSKVAQNYAGSADLFSPAGLKAAYHGFLTEDHPTWSGGPYEISQYVKNTSTTLVPNPKWYGATKPSLTQIIYKIILDPNQEIDALKNGEINVSTAQPTSDIVQQVQSLANTSYNLSAGPTWEHIDMNLKNKFLSDTPLRQAIFTAINRQEIITKTVLPFFPTAAPLNNHDYMPGMAGYTDVVTATKQGSGDLATARSLLEAAGYTGDQPGQQLKNKAGQAISLRFTYTQTNALRKTTALLVQNDLAQIGVKLTLVPVPDLSALGTGDYDMIVFAWVGSPFESGNKDLWSTNGGGNYGHYSNPQVDQLLAKAATDTDATQQAADFNAADKIMTQDAYVLPLYQKPVFIAVSNDFVNIRNNPTNAGPSYNMQDWGTRATAQ